MGVLNTINRESLRDKLPKLDAYHIYTLVLLTNDTLLHNIESHPRRADFRTFAL